MRALSLLVILVTGTVLADPASVVPSDRPVALHVKSSVVITDEDQSLTTGPGLFVNDAGVDKLDAKVNKLQVDLDGTKAANAVLQDQVNNSVGAVPVVIGIAVAAGLGVALGFALHAR